MHRSPAPRLIFSLVLAVLAGLLAPFAAATAAHAAEGPPCEVSWDGGNDTNRFDDAANWTGDRVPGINDDACIDGAHAPGVIDFSVPTSQAVNSLRTASDLSIDAGAGGQLRLVAGGSLGSVRITSGTLTSGGPLTAQQVTQSGGTVGGAGAIDVSGSYTWTGGIADGTGTTTVAGGLRLGTGNLSADQRRVRTTTGTASFAKETALHLTKGGALAIGGATSVEAATNGTGVNVVGDGTLEISGNVHFAADSTLSSDVATTTGAGSTLDLSAGDSDVDFTGAATIAGGVNLGARSTLMVDGEATVELTATAQVAGTGALEVTDGHVAAKPGAEVSIGSLTQVNGQIKGDLEISGDADLTDATWQGESDAEHVVSVGGTTTVHGSLTLRDAVLDGKDVTLAPGATESPEVAMEQTYAALTVSGKLRQTDEWAVISQAKGTNGEFDVHDVAIAAGQQLRVDPDWTLEKDQRADVAAKGSLWVLGHFVDNGTLTNSGEVILDADTTFQKDVESAAGSKILIGSIDDFKPTITLANDAAVGGEGSTITNNSFITGEGELVGTVTNNGRVAPAPLITIDGDYVQDALAMLDVALADGVPTGLRISGKATLDGTLKAQSKGTLHEVRRTVLGAASIQGSMTPDLEDDCDDVDATSTKIDVVTGACFMAYDSEVTEGESTANVDVELSRPMPDDVTLSYETLVDSADTHDFTPVKGTVQVPAGETVATVEVPITDDQDEEEDESFDVLFTSTDVPSDGGEATVTIQDDDHTLAFGAKGISALGSDQQVRGIGRKYAVGQFENQGTRGWIYDLAAEGIAEAQDGLLPTAISNKDAIVGNCGTGTNVRVCVRDHGVTSTVPDSAGTTIVAINDKGQLVGRRTAAHNTGVLYASPSAQPTVLDPIAGSEYSQALDVNEAGTVVGVSRVSGKDVLWTRTTNGTVARIGELPGDREHLVDLARISKAGNVLVKGSTLVANSWVPSSHRWSPQGGFEADPNGVVINDMNAAGDLVGTVNGRAKLWQGDKVYDLTSSAASGQLGGATMRWPHAISDQGVIIGEGTVGNDPTPHMFVLTPPGAGCWVCADVTVREAKYPHHGDMVAAGDEVVEGNPADIVVELNNTDVVAQTVKVDVAGDDGKAIGTERTIALAAGERQTVTFPWSTEGRAWRNGADAGTTGVTATVTGEDGQASDESSARVRVVPRPVVLVHREFYGPNSWSSYAAKLTKAHVGWKAAAVDTLDTTLLTSNPIGRNARLLAEYVAKTQAEQNAWQVDLLAEGAGGLISRAYIHRRMKDVDTVTPVRKLLMLGTMNAGTRCADMFGLPATVELGPAMVERFNARTFERRGVDFSALAGNAGWTTCGWPAPSDGTVTEESALHGVEDTMSMPITMGQLRGTSVFEQFVLPRLTGGTASNPTPLAAGTAMFGVAAPLAAAASAAPSTEAPQLLDGAETVTVGAGQTVRVAEKIPAGLDSIAATALVPGHAADVTVRLEQGGLVMATASSDAGDYVTAVADHPAAGSWALVVTNNGSSSIDVPLALAGRGAATRLVATADQVGVSHQVRVTAHLDGAALETPLRRIRATVVSGGGENQAITLTDDNGTWTGVLTSVPDGLLVLDVETDDPNFYRRTPVAVAVESLDDGPGNDAPVATDQQVTVPAGEVTRIDVEAGDPEGSPLTYDVPRKPAHGTIGGQGPHFEYRPTEGFHGTDSFTFRVNDGELWSEPATVSITVDTARTELVLRSPAESKAIQGKPFLADVLVQGPADEPVTGGTATFRFGDQVLTAPVSSGHASVQVPNAGMSAGRHDLDVSYDGTTAYGPSNLHTQIELVANNAPTPNAEPVTGEAGYRTRIQAFAGDSDSNAVSFAVDWDNDGTIDETKQVPETAGEDETVDATAAMFFHTYPTAWDGRARIVVTDAAGASGETTTPVHITAHRAQGPLARVTVGDKPVRLVQVSGDGRHVLYENRNQYAPNHPTAAFGVLDRTTGAHVWASVRPDGSIEDQPHSGVLSLDGHTVAWVGSVTPDSGPGALFVRDLVADSTQRITAPTGEPVALRGDRLFLVVQNRLMVLDLKTRTSTLLSRTADGTVLTVEAANPSHAAASSGGSHVVFGASGGQLWSVDLDNAGVPTPATRLAIPTSTGSAPAGLSVSDSGQDVVFSSEKDLVAADANGAADVYRFGRSAGTTELVSVTPAGKAGNKGSAFASMSADGQRVLFHSEAADLVPGDTNGVGDEFVRDLGAGTTRRISVEPRDDAQVKEESTVSLGLSSDGRYAFFESFAQGLVPDQTWSERDLYVRDLGESAPQCHLGTLADVSRQTAEDTTVEVPLAAGCEDSSWSVVDGPAHGTLTGTGASRSYSPDADWNGTDTFSYRVTHGSESATGIARVVVSPANDAPTAKDVDADGSEDQPLVLTMDGTDVDGDVLTFEFVGQPAHGSLSGTGATRTFTPAPDWNGTETIGYRVSDGQASATASAKVTLAPVNDAPVAKDLAGEARVGQPLALTFSGTDVDGDALTYEVASPPAHGTLTGTGTNRSYTPAAGWNGIDTFTYRASDGKLSATGTVQVAVSSGAPSTNHAPVAKSLTVCGLEDQTVKVTLSATDVDGDALTYDVATAPAHGIVSGTGTARSYTPTSNWSGTDTFSYRVSDGTTSSTATVKVTVAPVNDAPITKDVTGQGREDQPVKVTLPGSDVDGKTLTWKVVTTPVHGSITGTGATRTFTPKANWNGTEKLTFSVSDGKLSATGTMTVVISPVNDAPTVTVTGPKRLNTKDTGQFTATTSDVDGDKVTCRITWGDGSAATTGCQGRHTWPKAGTYTVTVTVTDAAGATTLARRSVTVTRCPAGVAGRLAV